MDILVNPGHHEVFAIADVADATRLSLENMANGSRYEFGAR